MVVIFFVGLLVEVRLFKFSPADSSALLLAVSAPNSVGRVPVVYRPLRPAEHHAGSVAVLAGNLVIVPTLLLLEARDAQAASVSLLRRYVAALLRCLKKAIVLAPRWGFASRSPATRCRPFGSARWVSTRKPLPASRCLSPGWFFPASPIPY